MNRESIDAEEALLILSDAVGGRVDRRNYITNPGSVCVSRRALEVLIDAIGIEPINPEIGQM